MAKKALSILLLHNRYQRRGGEDVVVENEMRLLREGGHSVVEHIVDNASIATRTEQMKALYSVSYNKSQLEIVEKAARGCQADVVHVHNFFPLLSPSVYDAALNAGSAVVQTLHNYRLACAGAMFVRNGRICEKCLHSSSAWGVVHRCYRNSFVGSLAVTRMQALARQRSQWDKVHRFIALTQFAKGKFEEAGLDGAKISVKPNSAALTARPPSNSREGALFVGRISAEKGVELLLSAWKDISDMHLTVVGGGDALEECKRIAPPNVSFTGELPSAMVREIMMRSKFLLVPSSCYEGFPMTIVEAYASGLPVIATRVGSLAEIVEDGRTGRLFNLGDRQDLQNCIRYMQQLDALTERSFRENAWSVFAERYSDNANLSALEDIYLDAIESESAA